MDYFDVPRRRFLKTSAGAAGAFCTTRFLPHGAMSATGAPVKKRPWIDTHIHVSDIGRDGKRRERMLEDLLDVLDRCDADLRFVISPDGHYLSRIGAGADGMIEANRMIHDLCRRAPDRLFGSCMINPNFTDESLGVMKTCFEEWGFVQLGEMLGYTHKYRMTDPGTEKAARLAAKYDVPIQVHLGTYWHKKAGASGDGMNQLADLLSIAERVPEAKYILAHAIGCGPTREYISWANMFLDTIQGVFPSHPDNFWIEIRDFQCPALPRAIREIPTTRLLSGTDWTTRVGPPFQNYGTMFDVKEGANPFPPVVESFVGFLRKAGATEPDVERIGYRNARELLKLPS